MLIDKIKDRVIRYNVELTELARRLRVMKANERMVEELPFFNVFNVPASTT